MSALPVTQLVQPVPAPTPALGARGTSGRALIAGSIVQSVAAASVPEWARLSLFYKFMPGPTAGARERFARRWAFSSEVPTWAVGREPFTEAFAMRNRLKKHYRELTAGYDYYTKTPTQQVLAVAAAHAQAQENEQRALLNGTTNTPLVTIPRPDLQGQAREFRLQTQRQEMRASYNPIDALPDAAAVGSLLESGSAIDDVVLRCGDGGREGAGLLDDGALDDEIGAARAAFEPSPCGTGLDHAALDDVDAPLAESGGVSGHPLDNAELALPACAGGYENPLDALE